MTQSTTTAPTAPSAVEFAALRHEAHTAFYKRDSTNHDWALVNITTDDGHDTVLALRAAGIDVDVKTEVVHLLRDGDFPDSIPAFVAPTAVSVLRGEIAVLRRKAEQARYDAGMGGHWDDGGASRYLATADAYEHAINVFQTYGH